jgi:hypothetical protein
MEAINGFIEAYKLLLERFSFQTDFILWEPSNLLPTSLLASQDLVDIGYE